MLARRRQFSLLSKIRSRKGYNPCHLLVQAYVVHQYVTRELSVDFFMRPRTFFFFFFFDGSSFASKNTAPAQDPSPRTRQLLVRADLRAAARCCPRRADRARAHRHQIGRHQVRRTHVGRIEREVVFSLLRPCNPVVTTPREDGQKKSSSKFVDPAVTFFAAESVIFGLCQIYRLFCCLVEPSSKLCK